jgi:2-polyprenyl-3-methyl-5-hydroxy-6-metoxy-1,4-benzoquinol methylase
MDRYKITFDTWNKLASIYQEKFMDLDLYDDSYDLFCQHITKSNPSILEIGCGPGNITKFLLSKRPGFDIEAIDVAPNMIKLAKKNNPKASFKVMDCREISSLNKKYDAVICGFCIPYLSKNDCEKLIADCSFLLNKGGILYLSAIEDHYKKSGYETGSSGDITYVYYYQKDYLEERLLANNLNLINIIRIKYPKKNDIQVHLIMMASRTALLT